MSFWYEFDDDDIMFWTNGEDRILEPLLQEDQSMEWNEINMGYVFNRTFSDSSFNEEDSNMSFDSMDSGYSSEDIH